MVWSDDVFENEVRPEWQSALPGLIAGKPDRTDLMCSIRRARALPSTREIISAVSHATGVAVLAITGNRGSAKIANARALVVLLTSETRPDMTQVHIAKALNRDRTTMRLALKRAEDLKQGNNDFVHWYANARKRLGLA